MSKYQMTLGQELIDTAMKIDKILHELDTPLAALAVLSVIAHRIMRQQQIEIDEFSEAFKRSLQDVDARYRERAEQQIRMQ